MATLNVPNAAARVSGHHGGGMRLAFDVTTMVKPLRGGIATYGCELIRAIVRAAPEHELLLAIRSNRWGKRELIDDLMALLPEGSRPRLLVDLFADSSIGRPDVMHAIGVRLPPKMRAARIFTLHDLNVFEFPELSDPDWVKQRQARIRETVARADLVISYSEQGKQALADLLRFPADRVRVVPCGVDTDRFRRPDPPVLEAVLRRRALLGPDGSPRPYVLLAGQLSARKNQAGLIAAFARACAERDGGASALPDNWLLVLPGPRDADADELRRLARAAGLPDDRVVLPGWVPDEDLPALLSGAALYVCASLHEGFGLPVLEAQACGTPVLCSDRGALKETLGGCGVHFDPSDESGFAAALVAMARDDALRAEFSRRGPARVLGGYSWEEVAKRTLAVHAEAAEGVKR